MRDAKKIAKIQQVLEHVWKSRRSNFYREKYEGFPQVKSWADFEKIPFLTKSELLTTAPPDRLYVAEDKIVKISITSGTTDINQPLVMFMTAFEQEVKKMFKHKFKKLGVKRILSLFRATRSDNFARGLAFTPPIHIIGDIQNFPLTARLAAGAEIDGIRSSPTILARFIPELDYVYDLNKVKWISLDSEICTKYVHKIIRKKFPKAEIDFDFGLTEAGMCAIGCVHLSQVSPRLFHPFPSYYFEIIDPESGQVLDDGQEGEIVITSLFISPTPLIRYRTGDLGVLTRQKCRCGNNHFLEERGRASSESLRISGVIIHVQKVKQAITAASDLISSDFCLHVYERRDKKGKAMPFLRLEVMLKEKGRKVANLEEIVGKRVSSHLFVAPKLTLADYVEKGFFHPLEVKLVENFPQEVKKNYIASHL